MKKLTITAAAVALFAALAGCTDADVASRNLSKAADQFEINRRIVFYNGITGGYMLTIEGLCSLGNNDKAREVTVTCKTGERSFKKHFLGLSDNVTYFAEQTDGVDVSAYHYRVVFKPRRGNSKAIARVSPYFTAMREAGSDAATIEAELGISPRRRGSVQKVERKQRKERASDGYLGKASG